MVVIIHRINTIDKLRKIPTNYGVEIDIRGYGEKLLLSHNPVSDPKNCDEIEEYLKNFQHAFIIFNVKESGYEDKIIELAKKYHIENYFLLDVEFPYIYRATRENGMRKIAIRYSEAEPIEVVESQIKDGKALLDWVWIDTNTKLPLNSDIINKLKIFKTCLVCPERWSRPQDIGPYIERIRSLGFRLDAVMTSEKYVHQWESSGIIK